MKKILSGILALMLAGTLTMPAFAAEEAAITATNVTTTVGTEPEATAAPESLKENAADEEGMLRISPSTLLRIQLKLEGDDAGGQEYELSCKSKSCGGRSNKQGKDTVY